MDFSEELWWQNLIEWIVDEGKIITYKTLASTLKVHVNMAKKMLATFYQGQKDLSAFYLIIGQVEDKLRLSIVAEKDVKKTEKSLEKVKSKHIFALCRAKMDLSPEDILNALDEINKQPDLMIPLRAVKNEQVKRVEPEVKKEEAKKAQSPAKSQVSVKTEAEPKVLKMETKEVDKAKPKDVQKDKTSKGAKGSQNKIASMFAKAPPPKKVVKDEEKKPSKPEPKEEPSKSTAPQTEVNVKKREQPTLKNSKKHKRIRMMSSSEDESCDDEEEKEEKKRYFSDAPIPVEEPESPEKEQQEDKENDQEVIPETPKNDNANVVSQSKKRRRGRRLVNKTFLDDSGFMVTKKEYVSCSESEEETAPIVQQPKSKIPYTLGTEKSKKSCTKSSEPSNEQQSKQPRKQASIKNFFTRK